MSAINGASAAVVKLRLNGTAVDFKAVAGAALAQADILLERWLPGGKWEGREYVVKNPTRADGAPGSFKINAKTGKWADFATGDSGGDLIGLRALLDQAPLVEAAKLIASLRLVLGPHWRD